ncbi:Stress-induced protein [Quillaja saponaria]|uniref:Stress-induced protein n=1 Tax=Quillaja saponaria TaxID=32244 RepID=A0AAD7M1K0_QUISA|nr:Stress-induced protein [Quillaja saponaria]
MSAMVEIWMGELEKLKEKVRGLKPLLSKAKDGKVVGEAAAVHMEARNENKEVVRENAGHSEETIFLIMDRFAPC